MQTTKILINKSYGGFQMTDKAKADLGIDWESDMRRDDPRLIEYFETHGNAMQQCSTDRWKVVEVPCDVKWVIKEYDGSEWVAEIHRTWS